MGNFSRDFSHGNVEVLSQKTFPEPLINYFSKGDFSWDNEGNGILRKTS